MAQEVVTFGDVVPSQMRVLPLATGAGRVARKVRREFLPVSSRNFTYESQPEIEFHVSAGKEMLIPRECFIRFTLNAKGTVAGAPDAGLRLSSSGVHALFRRIEISDRANRQIDVLENYDHISNIIGSVYEDKFYGELNNFTEGQGPVDTPAKYQNGAEFAHSPISETFAYDDTMPTGGANVTALGVVTENALDDFKNLSSNIIGRYVRVFNSDGLAVTTSIVTGITLGPPLSFTISPPPPALVTNGTIHFIDTPTRVGYNEDREFTVRLKAGLFDSFVDLPLFLMDGLQIKIYLNNGTYPFVSSPLAGTKSVTYTITDARFLCNLRTPSAEIRDQYLEMFDKGMLNYPFMSYHAISKFQSGDTTSRQEFDLAVSKSSLKKLFFVIQSDIERSATASDNLFSDSFASDSYRYINAGLADYQFKIGAMDYPSAPMRVPDKYAADAYTELLISCMRHRDDIRAARVSFNDWVAQYQGYVSQENTNGQYFPEPLKRIYAVRFDTIEDDMLSGVKTRGIGTDDNVVAMLNFSNNALKIGTSANPDTLVPATNRYVLFVFEHSKVLHISKSGILALD